MSTLDNRRQVQRFYLIKRVSVYLIASVFCLIVSNIYSIFSHGVSSVHMTYLFLYPLIFGVGAGLVLLVISKEKATSFLASHLYHTGVVLISISSLMKGIFEIAGTSSLYQMILTIVGFALIVVGVILFSLSKIKSVDIRRS